MMQEYDEEVIRCFLANQQQLFSENVAETPEEAEELNVKVALSGLSKRDYIVDCLLKHEIRVVCGINVARAMRKYLEAILKEL